MSNSPLLIALLEFYALIALVCVATFFWYTERLKRIRLQDAMREMERILTLASEATREGSAEKCESVNRLIELWDQQHARDTGTQIKKLSVT